MEAQREGGRNLVEGEGLTCGLQIEDGLQTYRVPFKQQSGSSSGGGQGET